jgi:hypothetical protein
MSELPELTEIHKEPNRFLKNRPQRGISQSAFLYFLMAVGYQNTGVPALKTGRWVPYAPMAAWSKNSPILQAGCIFCRTS